MKYITLFKNFTTVLGRRNLAEVVDGIQSDFYKESILKIRELVDLGDQEQVDRLKKGLVAFTVSGMFIGGRKMSFLQTYNPFVILDIDKLDLADLPNLILKTKEIEFTRVAFLSPSGRGLKIIVEVDSGMEKHGLAYRQVSDLYEKELGVEIDKSGKDITRLCFMSYDPEIYYEEESTIFKVLEFDNDRTQTSSPDSDLIPRRAPDLSPEAANLTGNYEQAFGVCVMQTNAKSVFKKGNRNNYIYQLGVICSHAGIPLAVAINESKKTFDFNDKEIERTIKSAYNWTPFPSLSASVKKSVELPKKVSLSIPDKIFNMLPSLLKRGCEASRYGRERDIFLTGAFGVLSGCLTNLTGIYDGETYHPNLFVFVIAPSASGKGALKYAKRLGDSYHTELKELSKQEREDYEKELMIYQNECTKFKKGKIEKPPTAPKKPSSRKLFIAADTSSAMLIHRLDRNGQTGVLFDAEADTLGNVLKQDWGGYSHLLRKSFHHDSISHDRKSNSDFIEIEIEHPRLSVVLSGTPDQVTSLIPSAKDGLFSRFIFYSFENVDKWRDVSREGRVKNFHSFYKDLSKEVLEMISFFKTHKTDFDLTKKQWTELNETFDKMMDETGEDFGNDAISVVKRHGLICFRLAMILSGIRKAEEKDKKNILICRDDDFEVAISLAKIYHEHALLIYDGLPAPNYNGFRSKNERKQLFFDALPDRFMRKEADAICPKFNMVARTGARYLKEFLEDGVLGKSVTGKYGEYFKKPID